MGIKQRNKKKAKESFHEPPQKWKANLREKVVRTAVADTTMKNGEDLHL